MNRITVKKTQKHNNRNHLDPVIFNSKLIFKPSYPLHVNAASNKNDTTMKC